MKIERHIISASVPDFRKIFFFLFLEILFCNTSVFSQEKENIIKAGIASYYSDCFNGRRTASGEIFRQEQFTCASNHFELGTRLKVINTKNGKSAIVKVNDRLGKGVNRIVDLTRAAAEKIGMITIGLVSVTVEKIK